MESDGRLSTETYEPYPTLWEPTADQKAIVEDALHTCRLMHSQDKLVTPDAAEIARAVTIILGSGLKDAFRDIDAVDEVEVDRTMVAYMDSVCYFMRHRLAEPEDEVAQLKNCRPQFIWIGDTVYA